MTHSDLDATPDQYDRVRDLIYRATGMIFGEAKRYYIERRLLERMRRTGHVEVASYLDFATINAAEREELVNAFTINETYFYRELQQFEALGSSVLPLLAAERRPGDLIRIWSMPCSSGEEPYSLAIWLLENWAMVDAYNIEIIGSDLDSAALSQAREGRYAARSLARLPADLVEQYFEPEQRHRRKLIDDLRESVRFVPANLVERSTLVPLGRFDIIFCRNLLIYFDEASRQVAAANLFESLAPGGYLFLGHSESMSRISNRFDVVRLPHTTGYRRP